jgi:hypothetical protein
MASQRRRGQETSLDTNNPLNDYDPQYLQNMGNRTGGAAAGMRGIPTGWSPCECGSEMCPDREIER